MIRFCVGCASNYFERKKKSSYTTNYNVRPLLGAYYLLYSISSSQGIFSPVSLFCGEPNGETDEEFT